MEEASVWKFPKANTPTRSSRFDRLSMSATEKKKRFYTLSTHKRRKIDRAELDMVAIPATIACPSSNHYMTQHD